MYQARTLTQLKAQIGAYQKIRRKPQIKGESTLNYRENESFKPIIQKDTIDVLNAINRQCDTGK